MERDPAAKSKWEVLLCYPSVKVMAYHRLAHRLYQNGHTTLARWISQHSRHVTGIEIHPGACIGKGFFIDHGDGVVIGAGAKVLGPFTVGSGSKIGASAVVLKEVPPNCTVVGNPGRVVRRESAAPHVDLDHVHLPDPIKEHIVALERRVSELEEQMHNHYGTTVPKEDIEDDADL